MTETGRTFSGLHYMGQQWTVNLDDSATYPPGLEEWCATLAVKRDRTLCDFGEWTCPRTSPILCGGVPAYHQFKKGIPLPHWIVYGYFPAEHGTIAQRTAVQSSLLPDLKPDKKKKTAIAVKNQVWIRYFFCSRGAAWAEALEKELGAIRTEVIKVIQNSRYKRRREVAKLVNFDPLELGSCNE